jgi:hypothetical protein
MIHYRSIADLLRVLYGRVIPMIGRVDIAAVWGVPRSGMLPATILATHYHARLGMVGDRIPRGGLRAARYTKAGEMHLVVEDCVGGGGGINNATVWVEGLGIPRKSIITIAPFCHPDILARVDITGEALPYTQLYEWNWLNSDVMPLTLFDMDGVICEDHPFVDGDPRYLPWVQSARPLFVPSFPILGVVSSRLEEVRAPTETWLDRYGVRRQFVDLFPGSREERDKVRSLAARKGEIYKNRQDAMLFVESHLGTAEAINLIAKKPVLCTNDGKAITFLP